MAVDVPTATDPEPRPRPSRRRARGRWLVAVAVLVVVGLVAAAVFALSSSDDGSDTAELVRENRPAPTFALPDLRRPEAVLALELLRGRPVVVNFWASWCPPCLREMPAFERVHQRQGDRVTFVGVNHRDERDSALHLLGETGVTYASGFDPEGKVAESYRLLGMPTTVFISPSGRVVATRRGEMSQRQLEAAIDELFG